MARKAWIDEPRSRLRAVGYIRVSTREQGDRGAGLTAQRRRIEESAAARDWELVTFYQDVSSGKSTNGRDGLQEALRSLEGPEPRADVLVVAKLDRLSRSAVDFGMLLERSRKTGWRVVALDLDVDTTTATGEMFAGMLVLLAQWERRLIGERTREGLAVKRAEGVRLGRPPSLDPRVRARIRRARARGLSLRRIAERLNEERVPTAQGGVRWYASTVSAALEGDSQ